MTKNFLKKFLPHPDTIKDHKHLKIFGKLLHAPNLWHFNRYSVSRAFAVGLFSAFVPIPFQMVLAAALAILFRAQILISIVLVWITNPITMPPIFYFCYKLGTKILGIPPKRFHFELSWEWLIEKIHTIGAPLLVGSLICGLIAAAFGFFMVRIIWRISVAMQYRERRAKRRTV